MNRKSTTFNFALWLSVWVSLNGCVYYKTVQVPVNQQSLKEQRISRPMWTIEDAYRTTRMIEPSIQNDSIVGKSYPLAILDHPSGKTYLKGKGKESLNYFHLYTSSPPFGENIKIPISEIKSATRHERDIGLSIFTTTTLSLVSAAAGAAIVLAIVCNCPYVSAVGTDSTQFQGSLFPGAISKSLERTDNLIMKTVPLNGDGKVNLKITNELPEIEFLGQIELFEVRDLHQGSLGLHSGGYPVSFSAQDHLLRAVTPENRDITGEIRARQGGFYDFNEQGNDYELNKVFLTFSKEGLRDNAMLIVRAKQSKWLETVAAFFLQQFGTAYDRWVDRMDKTDPHKYRRNAIDRGVSLNAYVKRNNQWDYLGSYEDIGTLAYRDLALNLDLSTINEETIEIKLEAAQGFWDIDYAGITDSWTDKISLVKLKTIGAVNQNGTSVLSDIEADDAKYAELPTEGSFTNMLFEPPSEPGAWLILRGKGYYHHQKKYTAKPNYKFLKSMARDKLTTHQLSRLLQSHLTVAVTETRKP